jgi:nicotinate-nucleotide adenylyltransferase
MLADFRTWRSPEEILEIAEVVALTRPEFPVEGIQRSFTRRITVCRIPGVGVSSSEIRRRVKEGKSIKYMVVPAVESYIHEHGLYR